MIAIGPLHRPNSAPGFHKCPLERQRRRSWSPRGATFNPISVTKSFCPLDLGIVRLASGTLVRDCRSPACVRHGGLMRTSLTMPVCCYTIDSGSSTKKYVLTKVMFSSVALDDHRSFDMEHARASSRCQPACIPFCTQSHVGVAQIAVADKEPEFAEKWHTTFQPSESPTKFPSITHDERRMRSPQSIGCH